MELSLLVLMILIVCIAAAVQGLTGFGAGIFMMCFLPLFLGYKASVSVCSIVYAMQLPMILIYSWKDIQWKKVLPVILPFSLFAILSLQVMFSLNEATLNYIFCGILIGFAVLFIVSEKAWKPRPSVVNGVFWGTAAGCCNILGICGPPLVYYLHSIFPRNKEYFANLQIILSCSTVIMLIQNGVHDNYPLEMLFPAVIAGLLSLVFLRCSMHIFTKLSRRLLTVMIIIFLLLMAGVHLLV